MKGSSEEKSAKSSVRGEDRLSTTQEGEIESAKAEIGEAREENERLKRMLERMNEDYKSLQVEFSSILRRAASRRSTDCPTNLDDTKLVPEPVCLSLGMSPVESEQEPKKEMEGRADAEFDPGFSLMLNTKLQLSPEAASIPSSVHRTLPEDQKDEDDAGETWPPSKVQKMGKDGDGNDVSQQAQVKRARVCVRARCDSHTMNDGCQWRKYGQKISKGNPCPRAYYRCTVAPACPVRKQVQRCVEDMSLLITTYEGTHNHPLPVSATAMASTTSAAAAMLLSGSSSTSQTSLGPTATTLAGLDGLYSRHPFYYPNSPAPLHPTITLDLTTTSSSSSTMTHSGNLNRFYSRPSLPGSNLGFSNNVPNVWGPDRPVYTLEKQAGDPPQSQSLTETLTKVLTTDPAFQSVIASAVHSMVGNTKSHPIGLPSFPLFRYPPPPSVSDSASKTMLDKDSTEL